MENWPRVADDSPERCKGTCGTHQCNNQREGISEYCPAHGGNRANQVARRREVAGFHIGRFQNRVGRLATADKGLDAELAMLRSMLEIQWNRCKNANELVIASGPISNLISQIRGTLESASKLADKMSTTMDATQAQVMGEQIIACISKHVSDSAVLEEIADEIARIVAGGGPGGV